MTSRYKATNHRSRHDEAAGHKLVVHGFLYFIGLAGEQRLVDVRLARYHDGICRHLLAACKVHKVAQHQRVGSDAHVLAIADCRVLAHVEQGQVVEHLLGAR